jgi:hypothetical protein
MLAVCPLSRVRRSAVSASRLARLRMRRPDSLHAWKSLSLRPPLTIWSGSYPCSNKTRSRSRASAESPVAPAISKTGADAFACSCASRAGLDRPQISDLCSPALAERGRRSPPILRGSGREQRLGIFRGAPALCAFSAKTANTRHHAASNSFGMRTYERIGRGYPPLLPSSLLTRAANICRINTCANEEANPRTFCTCTERRGGVGARSPLETAFSLPGRAPNRGRASRRRADRRRATNSSRICTCETIGLEPPVESTLAKKRGWAGVLVLAAASEILMPVTPGGVLTPGEKR